MESFLDFLGVFATDAAKSVVGAIFIYLFVTGWRVTRDRRHRVRQARLAETEDWNRGDPAVRQTITNRYLFGVLKYFLLGNVVWGAPSVILFFKYDIAALAELGSATGALFFFIGLVLTVRYLRLSSS